MKFLKELFEQYEQELLVEGIVSKFLDISGKAKSALSALGKYNVRKFASDNKAKIESIAKGILDQLLAGKKFTADSIIADITKKVEADPKLQSINEDVIFEDAAGFAGRVLTDLASVFMGFMAVLQSKGVMDAVKVAQDSPSKLNDIMLHGVTACLVIIVTGLVAAVALRAIVGSKEKQRSKRYDAT